MRWSASSLVKDCAYRNVLNKAKPKSANAKFAADRGTAFHAAIDQWANTGALPLIEDLEIQGWIDLLSMQWQPPHGAHFEIAWGLTPDGAHQLVDESQPHVYQATDGRPLLTAGRADVCWWTRPDVLATVDWKTGSWPVAPARENLQALAGAMALAHRFGAHGYQPGSYYARDGAWDWGDVIMFGSIEHANAWDAVKAAAELDETPRPGPHCAGCWERKACAHAERAA